MSDLSKRRPQIDFCAGYRAHKRGDPREGCSKAWHEGWDAHAELAAERARSAEAVAEILLLGRKVAKLREALEPFAKSDGLTLPTLASLDSARAVLEETKGDEGRRGCLARPRV